MSDNIDVQFREITDSSHEQIRRAVAFLLDAIAGAIIVATILGAATGVLWLVPTAIGWWGG